MGYLPPASCNCWSRSAAETMLAQADMDGAAAVQQILHASKECLICNRFEHITRAQPPCLHIHTYIQSLPLCASPLVPYMSITTEQGTSSLDKLKFTSARRSAHATAQHMDVHRDIIAVCAAQCALPLCTAQLPVRQQLGSKHLPCIDCNNIYEPSSDCGSHPLHSGAPQWQAVLPLS